MVTGTILLATVAVVSQFFVVFSRPRAASVSSVEKTLLRITAEASSSMAEAVRFDSLFQRQRVGGRVPFTITSARRDRRYELQQLRLTPFNGRGTGGPTIMLLTTPLAVLPEALNITTSLGWSTDEPMATSLTPDRGQVYGDWRVSETLDTVRSISLEGVVVRYRAERVNVMPFARGKVYADDTVSIQLTKAGTACWTSPGPLSTTHSPVTVSLVARRRCIASLRLPSSTRGNRPYDYWGPLPSTPRQNGWCFPAHSAG